MRNFWATMAVKFRFSIKTNGAKDLWILPYKWLWRKRNNRRSKYNFWGRNRTNRSPQMITQFRLDKRWPIIIRALLCLTLQIKINMSDRPYLIHWIIRQPKIRGALKKQETIILTLIGPFWSKKTSRMSSIRISQSNGVWVPKIVELRWSKKRTRLRERF